MTNDAVAYEALELRPGAGLAAVEAAYKRLIKRYHPDRSGGDAARAAEINRAYHYLRNKLKRERQDAAVARVRPNSPRQPVRAARTNRRQWLALTLASALLLALLVDPGPVRQTFTGLADPLAEPVRPRLVPRPAASATAEAERVQLPLDSDGIERSVLSAIRLSGDGASDRLIGQSRRCHAELRRDPDLARLDRCVAFDEAVVALMRRDPVTDRGPFSDSAVMARQVAAARLFPDDYLTVESRLARVRSQVEFSLAPGDPQPPPERL